MEDEEIDLKEVFTIFWNKKLTIFLIVLLAMILGNIYTFYFVDPVYVSSATLILVSNKNTENTSISNLQTDLTINSKLVSTYSELIKSKSVLRKVVTELKSPSINEKDLKANVSVNAVKDTELIEIQVKDKNPQMAAIIANEIAEVFSEKVQEIYKIDNVYVVDKAEVSENPSNKNHIKDIYLFAIVGGVFAVFYVFIIYIMDNTVKDPEEIEKKLKIPVLASIPSNQ